MASAPMSTAVLHLLSSFSRSLQSLEVPRFTLIFVFSMEPMPFGLNAGVEPVGRDDDLSLGHQLHQPGNLHLLLFCDGFHFLCDDAFSGGVHLRGVIHIFLL